MEFVQSYCTSSDDSDTNTNLQETASAEIDYFGLADSDSENETHVMEKLSSKLKEESLILSERPYGPELKPNFKEDASYIGKQIKRQINKQKISEKRFKSDNVENRSCCESLPSFLKELKTNTVNTKEIFNHSYPEITSIDQNLPCRLPFKKINCFKGHDKSITSVHWSVSQYSHLYLTSSLDNTVKIWDHFLGKCVHAISQNDSVKTAVWTICGTKVLTGGYSKTASIYNLKTGAHESSFPHNDFVSSVQVDPNMDNIILTGSKNGILVWDTRENSGEAVRSFTSKCSQVLDIAFINEGREILCSSDVVSRDSADRTIIAWDYQSGALLSNQIFQERYTCPCLKEEPGGKNFIAQTNGSYIAIFSTHRPYKLNKKKRYEGHKVSGYHIGCDFSPDGTYIISGDAEGGLYFYKTFNTELVKKFQLENDSPITNVAWHPLLRSTVVAAAYNGNIHVAQ